jgi:hypothetical protein
VWVQLARHAPKNSWCGLAATPLVSVILACQLCYATNILVSWFSGPHHQPPIRPSPHTCPQGCAHTYDITPLCCRLPHQPSVPRQLDLDLSVCSRGTGDLARPHAYYSSWRCHIPQFHSLRRMVMARWHGTTRGIKRSDCRYDRWHCFSWSLAPCRLTNDVHLSEWCCGMWHRHGG